MSEDKPAPFEQCDEEGCEEFACIRIGDEQKCYEHAEQRAELERRRRTARMH